MGLLTVYQINWSGAGPAVYPAGGPIAAKQQNTAQRSSQEFVTGKGFFMTDVTTAATAPLLGKFGNTPQYPYCLAIDQTEATTLSVGALAAGASTSITTLVGFNLPPLTLDPTDNATLVLVPNHYLSPAPSGLCIASVQIQPQALNQSNQWINATTLQGGQAYSAWRANVTIELVAVTATAATTLYVAPYAMLYVLPE